MILCNSILSQKRINDDNDDVEYDDDDYNINVVHLYSAPFQWHCRQCRLGFEQYDCCHYRRMQERNPFDHPALHDDDDNDDDDNGDDDDDDNVDDDDDDLSNSWEVDNSHKRHSEDSSEISPWDAFMFYSFHIHQDGINKKRNIILLFIMLMILICRFNFKLQQ